MQRCHNLLLAQLLARAGDVSCGLWLKLLNVNDWPRARSPTLYLIFSDLRDDDSEQHEQIEEHQNQFNTKTTHFAIFSTITR
jgi:hypothetical protein